MATKKSATRKPASKKSASKKSASKSVHVSKVPKSAIRASTKEVSVGKIVAMAHKMNMDPKTLRSVLAASGISLTALSGGIAYKHGGFQFLMDKGKGALKVVKDKVTKKKD